ncbi:Pro-Pol polyprotein, partial [Mucuna pruriens]
MPITRNQASSTNGGEEDAFQRLLHTVASLQARSDEQSCQSEEAKRRFRLAEERHQEALRRAQERIEELQRQLEIIKGTRRGEASTQIEASLQIFWGQPFSQEIDETRVPPNFREIMVEPFDGSQDSHTHLQAFQMQITLRGVAMQWMATLPTRTIRTFNDLANAFTSQFAANKTKQLEVADLFDIRQAREESLKSYLARFNNATVRVNDPDPKFFIKVFQKGLRASPFSDSLALKRPSSMDEIRARRRIKLNGWQRNVHKPKKMRDCMDYVKKCDKCQRFAEGHRAPPENLHHVTSPWPFFKWGVDILGPFPPAPGQVRFLIVAVDYFTKWVEAKPVATITAEKVKKFYWKKIICRFGIPAEIVSDNGTQFASKGTADFCKGLKIKQVFTSVEHLQSNGQAEAANKIILRGLRKRLEEAKGRWAEELPQVLWSYHTTPHSTTNETPFRLTFGIEAMILVEIGEPSPRTALFEPSRNEEELRANLDLVQEAREIAHVKEYAIKARADTILGRTFQRQGAYKLESLEKKALPRTWNAASLRMYYS